MDTEGCLCVCVEREREREKDMSQSIKELLQMFCVGLELQSLNYILCFIPNRSGRSPSVPFQPNIPNPIKMNTLFGDQVRTTESYSANIIWI